MKCVAADYFSSFFDWHNEIAVTVIGVTDDQGESHYGSRGPGRRPALTSGKKG
jgi:hypothetical protein